MNTRAPGFNADDEPWDAWGDEPSDTALVAAFVALPDDYADSRERAISSLRWACDPIDYDLMMAAGDLGGAELDAWKDGL